MVPSPSDTSKPRRFEDFARQEDVALDVAWGAALLAKDAHPNLDADALMSVFDDLAAPLAARRLHDETLPEQARILGEHVFTVLSFRGNEQAYYDPRNSLLDEVIDRRLGIPITLALVYCELARRAGVRARGISFPGHFLVRLDEAGEASEPLVVDPFYGGQVLTRAALTGRLRRALGAAATLSDAHLAPAESRAVLVRMALNLKHAYLARGDVARALLALDRIVSLDPTLPAALLERASLAERLGALEAARADLRTYADRFPQHAEAVQARKRLAALEAKATTRGPLN